MIGKVLRTLREGLILSLVTTLATVAVVQQSAAEVGGSARDQIQTTIDSVVKIVETNPGADHREQRRAELRKLLDQRFDFEEMSKRSLGTHWTARTPQERTEFVSLFSELLAKTYLGRIEEVKSGMVKIGDEISDGKRSTVKTKVKGDRDTFPIDYKLHNLNGEWRVYDVIIENIGLVSNYRNEFAGIIRKDEFAGLIQKLKEKNAG